MTFCSDVNYGVNYQKADAAIYHEKYITFGTLVKCLREIF